MYKLSGGLLVVLAFCWTGSAVAILLAYSPLVASQVFQCKDPVTGKITFTDLGCPDKKPGAYLPVKPANVDSGYPSVEERKQSRPSRSYSYQPDNIAVIENSGIRKDSRIQPAPRISDRRSSVASRTDRTTGYTGPYRDPMGGDNSIQEPSQPSSPQWLIDPFSGNVMPRSGAGYFDIRDGTFYHDVGPGVVNIKTGEFTPTN